MIRVSEETLAGNAMLATVAFMGDADRFALEIWYNDSMESAEHDSILSALYDASGRINAAYARGTIAIRVYSDGGELGKFISRDAGNGDDFVSIAYSMLGNGFLPD